MRYSSLLGRCLRLVSHAVGTLPDLWLRAFHRRSSLSSLSSLVQGAPIVRAVRGETTAEDHLSRDRAKRPRLLDILPLRKGAKRPEQAATGAEGITRAAQRRVDFAGCRTSLPLHGRQISESESETKGTTKGESRYRGPEERATGRSRQGGTEKEVGDANSFSAA